MASREADSAPYIAQHAMPEQYHIDRVKPSALFGMSGDVDGTVRNILARYEPALNHAGTDDYNLNRFRTAAFNVVPWLLSLGLNLRKSTLLEVGSGRGLKGLAVGDIVGRYIGIDLDPHEIKFGRALRRDSGRDPDELILGDAIRVLSAGEVKLESIDVLMLYAVLEHLTPAERTQILTLARTVYDRGGVVIIAETPNRLYPFDHHSSQRHFLQMLPDDLARRHLEKFSDNPVSRFFVGIEPSKALEMLYRSGRALSYHDFEVDFCPGQLDLSVTADGYHPCLVNLQPISRAELDLQTYFLANRIQVPRCFSRAWLDMVLVKDKGRALRSLTLLAPSLMERATQVQAPEFWDTDRYIVECEGSLTFEPPPWQHSAQLLVDAHDAQSGIEIQVDGCPAFHATAAELLSWRPPTWHTRFAVPLQLPARASHVAVRVPKGCSPATILGLLAGCAAE